MALLAYVSVTVFYALKIYLASCTLRGFGSHSANTEVQYNLHSLITAAQRTLSIGAVNLIERFQWALLIAGIETDDMFQQEWIAVSISDSALRMLLRQIREEKKRLGGEITMAVIRRMVREM